MKKLFLMAVAAVMSLGASAQLISSNTVTHKKGNGYNRLSVSYNSLSFDNDKKFDIDGISGLSVAWTKGISISQSTPLFIETGIGATYAWGSKEDSEGDEYYSETYEDKSSFLNLTIPVNLVYKWEIPNSGITLAPFAGIYLRGNILAQSKSEWTETSYRGSSRSGESESNWFNDIDDQDEPGYEASRISFGWNIGVGVEWEKLYVGISYANDLNKFVDISENNYKLDTKISTFSATVGFNF